MNLQDVVTRLDPNWSLSPEELIGRVCRVEPCPRWYKLVSGSAERWVGIKCQVVDCKPIDNTGVDDDEGPHMCIRPLPASTGSTGVFPGREEGGVVWVTVACLRPAEWVR